jgi:NADH-quinone oxidoreductase subunit N
MELVKQLEALIGNLGYIGSEIFTAIVFCVAIGVDLFLTKDNKSETESNTWLWAICFGTLLVLLYMLKYNWLLCAEPVSIYKTAFYIDRVSIFAKMLLYVSGIIALFHIKLKGYQLPNEFYTLFLFQLLGLQVLCMADHWLVVFIAIEIVSIASYGMVGQSVLKNSTEATLKYAVIGGVSAALLLYGISFFYGITGDLSILSDQSSRFISQIDPQLLRFVVVWLMLGLLFKLAAFPMHTWVADVYQTTALPVVSYLSVAPKVAIIMVLMRFYVLLPVTQQNILIVISGVGITFANLAALGQTDVKRLLAFSSIAQAGFLLCGLVLFSITGLQATFFYLFTYLVANMGAFYLVDITQRSNEGSLSLESFHGLGSKNVLWGICLTLCLLSLLGLPPLAGFMGKLLLFNATWEAYQASLNPWLLVLFILIILNTVIALFYYLKIPFVLFFRKVDTTKSVNFPIFGLGAILSLVLLYYFFASNSFVQGLSRLFEQYNAK